MTHTFTFVINAGIPAPHVYPPTGWKQYTDFPMESVPFTDK